MLHLGSVNNLRTSQVLRVSTLAWRVRSVGSDHKQQWQNMPYLPHLVHQFVESFISIVPIILGLSSIWNINVGSIRWSTCRHLKLSTLTVACLFVSCGPCHTQQVLVSTISCDQRESVGHRDSGNGNYALIRAPAKGQLIDRCNLFYPGRG